MEQPRLLALRERRLRAPSTQARGTRRARLAPRSRPIITYYVGTPEIGPGHPPNRAGRRAEPPVQPGWPEGWPPAATTLWNARAARIRAEVFFAHFFAA